MPEIMPIDMRKEKVVSCWELSQRLVLMRKLLYSI